VIISVITIIGIVNAAGFSTMRFIRNPGETICTL